VSVWSSGLDAIGATAAPGGARAVAGAAAGGAHVGEAGMSWFVTPDQIEAKVRELDASFGAMHTAILSYTPTEPRAADWKQWRDSWVAFRAGWEGYTNQLRDALFTSPLGAKEMLLNYQTKLADWQADFRDRWGAKIPGPAIEKPKGQDSVIRTIGIGIAIAVGSGLVLWGIRKVAGL
jgi:hypothetical protein